MELSTVVKARTALNALLSGYNVPEEMQPLLMAAADAMLAYERQQSQADRDAAMEANAGPREEWEIA